MLVSMKIDVEEHNKQKDFHGTTEVLEIRDVDGVELQLVTTFADTNHKWWESFADEAEEDGTFAVDCIEEVQKGVWLTLGGNFHGTIDSSSNVKLIDSYPNVTRNGDAVSDGEAFFNQNLIGCYMVCDNVEQALEYWKGAIINPDEQYVIALMPVLKQGQPEDDGWRWEKWGKYIGTQNPQCDYLFDEPEINKVYCAHIYHVQEKV
jgi:hypothetical protein